MTRTHAIRAALRHAMSKPLPGPLPNAGPRQAGSRTQPWSPPPKLSRQRGAYGIAFALLLLPLMALFGLAFDLAMVYGRYSELQALADATALSAARKLDGTTAGISAALNAAEATAGANWVAFNQSVEWEDAAVRFGSSSTGPWLAAGAVNATNVSALRYVQVDTTALSSGMSGVTRHFWRLFDDTPVQVNLQAVAGRRLIKMESLAICALSTEPTAARSNALGAGNEELVEYGFRRGMGYNLLNLNPQGLSPVNFKVNPIDLPPAPSQHDSDAALKPFICSGTVALGRVGSGTQLHVQTNFPTALVSAFNVRFDSTGTGCDVTTAPPDLNIKDYTGLDFGTGGIGSGWFMQTPVPTRGSAQPSTASGALKTIGDDGNLPANTTASAYGTLWSFARPVRFASRTSYSPTQWSQLYPVNSGPAVAQSFYPSTPPYQGSTMYRKSPTNTGLVNRRVLNVPLLACPVGGSTATVLAIGRFLMLTPASTSPAAIHAEFGGVLSEVPNSVVGLVK